MKPISDFAVAMRLAAVFAEGLPEGCPFIIDTDEQWAVDMEIAARNDSEFWQAALVMNALPVRVGEVNKSFGNLHISLYLCVEDGPDAA